MKTITSFIAALLFCSFVYSQVNYPIPQDSTSAWRIWRSTWDPLTSIVQSSDFRVFVSGDTTINGKVYSKLLHSGLRTYEYQGITNTWSFENELYTFIRTDSARTYVYDYNHEELLFDFSLQPGDTLPETMINGPTVVISSIDSVLVDGKYLKRFNIYDSVYNDLLSNWYIEGIGHEFGLIEPMYMMLDNGWYFECYAENGIPVFNPEGNPCDLTVDIDEKLASSNSLKAFPNPSNGVVTISYYSSNEENISIQIIGISGESIIQASWSVEKGINEKAIDLSPFRSGIYLLILKDGTNIIHRRLALNK